jgi:hypothetical protein
MFSEVYIMLRSQSALQFHGRAAQPLITSPSSIMRPDDESEYQYELVPSMFCCAARHRSKQTSVDGQWPTNDSRGGRAGIIDFP